MIDTKSMILYWVEPDSDEPCYELFPNNETQLTDILERARVLRSEGKLFVTTASHSFESGGIVRDGKLPNGQPYTWKKRLL
jgi:hypothetical protein